MGTQTYAEKVQELDQKARIQQLNEEEEAERKADEEAKKNRNFFMIYKTSEGADRQEKMRRCLPDKGRIE